MAIDFKDKLRKVVKNKICKTRLDDAGFIFNAEDKETIIKSFDEAYDNDDLESFYLEFWEEIAGASLVKEIGECHISESMGSTYINLYAVYSKNLIYSRVIGSGTWKDMIYSDDIFYICPKNKQADIVKRFEKICNEVYTCNGEFTKKQAEKNGSTIVFDAKPFKVPS